MSDTTRGLAAIGLLILAIVCLSLATGPEVQGSDVLAVLLTGGAVLVAAGPRRTT